MDGFNGKSENHMDDTWEYTPMTLETSSWDLWVELNMASG